jgi:hypothetical protein
LSLRLTGRESSGGSRWKNLCERSLEAQLMNFCFGYEYLLSIFLES